MQNVMTYRQRILNDINEIPEEFLPFLSEQIKAFGKKFKTKGNKKKESATDRLLKLAGSLENPDALNARDYKRKAVDEYLAKYLEK